MRALATAFIAAGLAGGAAVGVVRYQASSPGPAGPASVTVPMPTARPTVVKVRLRPCEAGWTLRKATCVRVVQKQVPAPVSPRPTVQDSGSVRRSTPAPTAPPREAEESRGHGGDDDLDEVEHEDRHDDEGGEDAEDREQEHED